MFYPEDDNGNVLRRMAAQGKDLTKARNIDFTVVFAHASSAEQFAEHFRELGYAVSVRETATEEDFPWDVMSLNIWCLPMKGSLILKTCCNRLQTVGMGTMMAGAVSPSRVPIKGT